MHWEGMDVCCTNPGPDDAGDFDEGNAGWYFRSLHLEWPRHGLSPMLAAEQARAGPSGRLQVLGLSKAVRLQRRLATPFQEDVPPNPNNATSSEHAGMVV